MLLEPPTRSLSSGTLDRIIARSRAERGSVAWRAGRPLRHTHGMAFRDEQRLAFGSVAELYDRARPSYPPGAIDDVVAHAGLQTGDTVLEVGAGTGKATVLLAQRGLGVLALEP